MVRLIVALAIVLGLFATDGLAAYPERPIRIIVPFPAGAGNDLLARIIGQKLAAAVGQPVVIENRAGAGGNIGTEVAARAAPDGYTILMLNNAQTMNAALNPKLSFDVVRDFTGLAMLAASPMLLVAGTDFPPKTVPELVAYARSQPGKVNYGSSGYGTPQHFGAEMLGIMSGTKMTHVPYKGQAPSNAALVSNEIQIAFGTVAGFAPLIKAGRIRPIAAAGTSPPKEFPDLPTVAQTYPGFRLYIWYGLVVPSATPAPIVKYLSEELLKILANPTNRAELEEKGFEVTPGPSEQLTTFIRNDYGEWKDVVQRAKLQPPDAETP